MNKILIAVFDSEAAANSGLQALHRLHAQGDITLYATGVMMKDAGGVITVKTPLVEEPVGAALGLAVGSMIGLLGGPVGVAVGAMTGTVVGAVRDFWVAGVGLDFIEEAEKFLQPGKTALVAEIEEEWVIPVDAALEAAGGRVFRRHRSELAQARLEHDVAAFQSEIGELESEVSNATGEAKVRLQTKLGSTRIRLKDAVHRAGQWVDALKHEADAKAEVLKTQWERSEDSARSRIADRRQRVKDGYHARGAKLSQAWGLMKEALAI